MSSMPSFSDEKSKKAYLKEQAAKKARHTEKSPREKAIEARTTRRGRKGTTKGKGVKRKISGESADSTSSEYAEQKFDGQKFEVLLKNKMKTELSLGQMNREVKRQLRTFGVEAQRVYNRVINTKSYQIAQKARHDAEAAKAGEKRRKVILEKKERKKNKRKEKKEKEKKEKYNTPELQKALKQMQKATRMLEEAKKKKMEE